MCFTSYCIFHSDSLSIGFFDCHVVLFLQRGGKFSLYYKNCWQRFNVWINQNFFFSLFMYFHFSGTSRIKTTMASTYHRLDQHEHSCRAHAIPWLVASKWRHQLYKIQIHSESLAILKKKPDCDNDNKMRATDTLSIKEYSPCINNSESLSEKCDEKLWQPDMHFFLLTSKLGTSYCTYGESIGFLILLNVEDFGTTWMKK